MTTVRHIPEEELHAYLDQALSRSQAAEIELHLARCPRCQLVRDDIARLRDRTTAILAEVGPPVVVPPAFAVLRARAAQRATGRRRWLVAGVWAASLAGAVLLGWSLHRTDPGPTQQVAVSVPQPIVSPTRTTEQASPPVQPAPRARSTGTAPPGRLMRVASAASASEPPVRFASLVEADPTEFLPAQQPSSNSLAAGSDDLPDLVAQPLGAEPGLQGLWRTIAPDSSGLLRSVDIPLVPGLPVVQMRVQPGEHGPDVTAVDQMLESGELVRTLSGPAARVSALVAAGGPGMAPARAAGSLGGLVTVTIQQGDRMVAVTGPTAALGSLLNRVNARRRY